MEDFSPRKEYPRGGWKEKKILAPFYREKDPEGAGKRHLTHGNGAG